MPMSHISSGDYHLSPSPPLFIAPCIIIAPRSIRHPLFKTTPTALYPLCMHYETRHVDSPDNNLLTDGRPDHIVC